MGHIKVSQSSLLRFHFDLFYLLGKINLEKTGSFNRVNKNTNQKHNLINTEKKRENSKQYLHEHTNKTEQNYQSIIQEKNQSKDFKYE